MGQAPIQAGARTARQDEYWHATRRLMIIHMLIWAFFSFVVHIFAVQLNQIPFFDFPLGYYMAAQGSLIAFVVQLFVFVWQQNRIDTEYGVAEDEA